MRKTTAGPGGKTRPFGGAVKVSDFRSLEIDDSMKTRRALEWKAWLEKPRSIRETVASKYESDNQRASTQATNLGHCSSGGR